MPYDYDTTRGVNSLNTTTPVGNQEPGTSLDDAVRQVLAYLTDTVNSPDSKADYCINKLNNYSLPSNTAPTGVICSMAIPNAIAIPGFVLCDGRSLSRATYSALFAVIGTTFGNVDANTFKVPDLRGRAIVGKGNSSDFGTIGSSFGSETVTLVLDQMPKHRHKTKSGTNLASKNATYFSHYGFWNSGINSEIAILQARYQGGDKPHANVQPALSLNFYIKT